MYAINHHTVLVVTQVAAFLILAWIWRAVPCSIDTQLMGSPGNPGRFKVLYSPRVMDTQVDSCFVASPVGIQPMSNVPLVRR